MSKYTTGDIAKLCGVSVRTVQYYDSRNILVPSELSEGGRRLYSEDDLRRMKIICFLREAGVSISSIGELFSDEDPETVIAALIDRRNSELQAEMSELQKKLNMLESIRRGINDVENFSISSIGDIAYLMKNKKRLRRIRWGMLFAGIPVSALQWISIVLWLTRGTWYLFAVWAFVAVIFGAGVSAYYFRNIEYICPECHEVFRAPFKEIFWAYHTPTMRRLTCPNCGRRGMCIETAVEKEENKNV